jgi:radical SAM-linked protein
MWERALRRVSVPVAYTAGFSPRPRLSFGLALPTGCESLAEYLDVDLATPMQAATIADRLEDGFPPGISVMAAAELEGGGGSLQQDVTSCSWEIAVPGIGASDLEEVLRGALAAPSLRVVRMRKGREQDDDLRPAVRELSVHGPSPQGCVLRAELATRPRGVRPSELARALGIEFGLARRTHQWIENEGSRSEPLSTDTAPLLAVQERVS